MLKLKYLVSNLLQLSSVLIISLLYLFTSSLRILFYDMSTATTTRILHGVRCSASSSNFQYLLFSLRSYSRCPHLLPRPPIPCIFYLTSNYVFYKAFPAQDESNLFSLPSFYYMQVASFLFVSTQWVFILLMMGSTDHSYLLQQNISKLWKYLWTTFLSVQFQVHTKLYFLFSISVGIYICILYLTTLPMAQNI